jgi:hypothetical protein
MLLAGVAVASAGVATGVTLSLLGRAPLGIGVAVGSVLLSAALVWVGRAGGSTSQEDQLYVAPSEAITAKPEYQFSAEARTPRPDPTDMPGPVRATAEAPAYGYAPPGFAPPAQAGASRGYGSIPSSPQIPSAGPVVGGDTAVSDFVPDYSAKAVPGLGRVYSRLQRGEIRGHLLVVGGPDRGTEVDILDDPITIGRDESNTMTLKDHGVSSFQATIVYQQGAAHITDNRSKNGTYVNNAHAASQQLDSCDVIAFGQTKILVTLAE